MENRRSQPRSDAPELWPVCNSRSGERVGDLANLSADGAMLIVPGPIKALTVVPCRLDLPKPILGRDHILFEAECRWCRKNVKLDRWEAGFRLEMNEISAELVLYVSLSFAIGVKGIPGLKSARTVSAEDLRDSTRYDLCKTVPVYEQASYHEIGVLSDLSTHGMGLITRRPLEKGTIIKGRARLPRTVFRREYLYFEAECRWCHKDDSISRYRAGILLKSVSETDRMLILNLIIHYSETKSSTARLRVVH